VARLIDTSPGAIYGLAAAIAIEPMRSSRKLTTDLTIRDDLSGLAVLRDNLNRIGAELGVPDKPLMQLQVALDEIASNVIKYGWHGGGNHELRVRITGYRDRIEVEIIDDGREFDPRHAPPPEPLPAGRRRPGGLGIHMVKQLVDRVGYERVGGHNRTIITKQYVSDRRSSL
jgi:anti-sigma regulatory factor (Ser/Thr protein kinase)